MSMNVYIYAERTVTARNKAGKKVREKQRQQFEALQTPTTVSYEIRAAGNQVQAYKDYVRSCGTVEKVPVYAPEDIWSENGPISYEEYNWAEEHIEEFDNWLSVMDEAGYNIVIEVW